METVETVAVPLSVWQDLEMLEDMFKWFLLFIFNTNMFSGLNIKYKCLLQSSIFYINQQRTILKLLWFHLTEMVGFRARCIRYYIINSPVDIWRKCLKVDLKATGINSCGFAGLKSADRLERLGAWGMSLRKKWFLDSSADIRSAAKSW